MKKEKNEKFCMTLSSLREEKGLKMKEVAEGIGINPTTYRKYENGDLEPSFTTLSNLAGFFGVSTDYLLGRPDAKPPENPLQLLADQKIFDELEEAIFEQYIQLPEDTRKEVIKFMYQAAEKATRKRREKATSSTSENPDTSSVTAAMKQYSDQSEREVMTCGELEDMRKAEEELHRKDAAG